MKEILTKQLLEVYQEVSHRRGNGNFTLDQCSALFRPVLKELSQCIPSEEKWAYCLTVDQQSNQTLHVCTTCDELMVEGFVIHEPHQVRHFCSETCLSEAGITMEMYNQNYDEEGQPYDPPKNPEWNSYYYEWY